MLEEPPLIADTNISEEISQSRNIILFQSAEIPGLWYETHKERIPVTFTNGEIEIGGKKGREMVCIYPNPLATNRYIVLVCAEKLSPEIIWRNHCDILLDDLNGSFDRFWHTIHWRNGDQYPRTDSNKIAQTEQISGYTTIKSKGNAAKKESLLKRVGRIVVLIIGGCLVMYFVGRSVYERIVGRE